MGALMRGDRGEDRVGHGRWGQWSRRGGKRSGGSRKRKERERCQQGAACDRTRLSLGHGFILRGLGQARCGVGSTAAGRLLDVATLFTLKESYCKAELYTVTRETKSAQVNLRLQPSLKEAAEKAAADDHRSLTSLVEKLLADYLRKKGYLPKA